VQLKIIPLGGLGEIGMNMMVFEYGTTMFIIDAGLMFPEDYMLGVDFVIPDMDYVRKNHSLVTGIVLTHAHEDHIGALPFLLRCVNAPVFGTPFTLGMVRNKLEEFDLAATVQLHEINPGELLKLGAFELEFIRVGHSVVDGVGIAIKTPFGTIIHTGDFKIAHSLSDRHTTDVGSFARFGRKGVLALFSDSTNVEKEGYTISGSEISRKLAAIVGEAKGRIIIGLFASNIARIQHVVNVARDQKRKIVFNGRSIEAAVNIAKDLNYLQIPVDMEVSTDQIDQYADDEIIIVTTGSQGEPMSALARMAGGTHRQIAVKEGDTVILSSKFIPGNERAIANIINKLFRKGANVIYEKISEIHVSGHAFREELKLMINLTRPKYFIPIHGEYRHLIHHARLAESMGIPENRILLAEDGQVIHFGNEGCSVKDRIFTGRIMIDGKGVGDVGRSVLKERRLLSEEGLVVVNLAFDEETGVVVYGPEIVSRGFVFETATGHLINDAQCVVLEIIEDVRPDTPGRVQVIRNRLQSALRQYFYFTIGRRPVILPFVMVI
jgi:ribonuclease J